MISIAHRLSFSFPGVLVFPPSRGLVCQLVLGGRQEKRQPKTRDKRPPLFPVEVENSRGFTRCDNILNSCDLFNSGGKNQILISNSQESEVHFSYAHRCLGSSITVTWVLSLRSTNYTNGFDECVGRLQRRLRHSKPSVLSFCELVHNIVFAMSAFLIGQFLTRFFISPI